MRTRRMKRRRVTRVTPPRQRRVRRCAVSRCRTPSPPGPARRRRVQPAARGVGRDRLGAAGLEVSHEVLVTRDELALRGIQLELGAGVGDVEVAHGQLADPVDGAEGRALGALHRELLGVVAEGGAGGVDDRVVVAATQPHGDLAGDDGGDPALQRLAQHQRLRVEPAAFVEKATEAAALGVVVGDGVLVVDRVEQSLVGDPAAGPGRGPRRCRGSWPR